MIRWKRPALALAATTLFGMAAMAGLDALDRAYPPPLDAPETSVEVVDRDGALLRALATKEGAWRFRVTLDDVDPHFTDMLIAYEDRRFHSHNGVDLFAMARAAVQFAANGRIVSGGSTITMQLARLIEPREQRSMMAKLRQMARAIQIERRLSKDKILERYLTLAPYGGNLEGIRAATLAWYGKEPKRLGLGESALLVSLPQLPERRRPDRDPENAQKARDRVLDRMVSSELLDQHEASRGKDGVVPNARRDMPFLAAHAAERVLREAPQEPRHQLTVSRRVQEALEQVAADAARRLGPRLSVAMVMADAHTGDILAEVGSAGFFDERRFGWVDMTRAVRSPGSTLKPFIFALAFEEGWSRRKRSSPIAHRIFPATARAISTLPIKATSPSARRCRCRSTCRRCNCWTRWDRQGSPRASGGQASISRYRATSLRVSPSHSAAQASHCAISCSSTPALPIAETR